MKRMLMETALAIGVVLLGLEVVHYRNAVLEANVDRTRAWRTVTQLRHAMESAGLTPPPGESPPLSYPHWP